MSKPIKAMIIFLVLLLIAAIAALVVVLNSSGENVQGKELTIDEVVEYSYESPEITTDLEDGSFVRIQFQILTDSKEAKEEVTKREFQLKNIIIKELAVMNEENFKSGLGNLEDILRTKLNEVMKDGSITAVYTINKILQ
ncbi:flagellar basal body-associated protein FliL [Oceanobacillus sp. 143]|uniref:Flagellar protein FliL n=1 Tax=Oceanobacillus zhaokaii TaxID=2052660 RepID=A0A345PGG1_9BACI|nr:flagellar basal body-associated protein FliL [Oceanobacillus zhaokaii]AXI09091.1 flagellar basal body-associated protein FliL [Oceanobacillus zhaokaii]QGS68657.1 flagellar basal body-associated protein FliL [Oceanobacillus sp. 143]